MPNTRPNNHLVHRQTSRGGGALSTRRSSHAINLDAAATSIGEELVQVEVVPLCGHLELLQRRRPCRAHLNRTAPPSMHASQRHTTSSHTPCCVRNVAFPPPPGGLWAAYPRRSTRSSGTHDAVPPHGLKPQLRVMHSGTALMRCCGHCGGIGDAGIRAPQPSRAKQLWIQSGTQAQPRGGSMNPPLHRLAEAGGHAFAAAHRGASEGLPPCRGLSVKPANGRGGAAPAR